MITTAKPHWAEVTRWAALAGDWDLTETSARYKPSPAATASNVAPLGLAICDERFRDGLIRATLRFEGEDGPLKGGSAGIVLGYHSESGDYLVAGLGAFDFAYCIWEFSPALGWQPRHRSAGTIHNLRYNRDYDLKVTQKGQRISLAVDDVPVLEHLLARPLSGNQLGIYAWCESPVVVNGYAVQRRSPMAFVAMQFGDPYDKIYRSVVKPKAEKLGFEVVRIDEVNKPGIIFQDIQRKIEDAKVVIAEISAPNQNVYYEIGYAHALNKPTILLAQRGKELPFDIRSYRVIFYEDSIAGKPLVERTLREHLHSILQEI
ncbi:MAG TPA: hypothetical protein VFI31_28265 [Pirellulales bacterium]|nr:hypothetical protein [Pirellulales bacterium]